MRAKIDIKNAVQQHISKGELVEKDIFNDAKIFVSKLKEVVLDTR